MFKKKENKNLEKELKALRKARDSVDNSKKSLDEIVKVYEGMQKDMIKAIKQNQMLLSLHSKAMLEVDDRMNKIGKGFRWAKREHKWENRTNGLMMICLVVVVWLTITKLILRSLV